MKKSLVSMLSLVVAAGLLTACGGSGQNATGSSAVKSSAVKSESVPASKVSQIVTGSQPASASSTSSASTAKVEPVEKTKVFVSPEWIKSVIDGKQEESKDFVILEAAWGEVADDKAYTEGHIPGALHMNTDYIESEEFWNIRTPEEITELMKKYGITKDTTVITYGNSPVISADDRVAMTLLWAGVENVKNLSGGIDAWKNAGYELETTVNEPKATDKDFGVTIPAHPEYILSIDQVKDKLKNDKNFKLVSIRSRDEFEGKTSGYGYIDRAGEPLGAIWGHDTDDGSYNNEDGTVANIVTVKKYLAESGASLENEVSYYCGTGWRAAIPFLIEYDEGIRTMSVYDGGWFQWQMDPENPVQLGAPGSADYKEVKVKDLSTDKAKK
ncbi:MAG: sulfurtransferase [Catonella sp.]